MKPRHFYLMVIAASSFSCTPPPNNNANTSGVGAATDPNNPYAIPGVSTQGSYIPAAQAPAPTTAPYQPIPTPPVNAAPTYTPPAITPPISGGTTHTVSSGDSLWGLSRKYNVSVDEIRQANGLSGDLIRTGQTLTIPR